MNYVQIINIVAYVLCVALFAFVLYYKIKGKVVGAVSELIAMAEETGLPGREKMYKVVEGLSEYVPAALRGIFTPERLEDIAQWIFDWMRKYAVAFIDTHEHGAEGEMESTNAAMMQDMINRLSVLGKDALRELAIKSGINVEDKSDEEILKAIVLALFLR